MKPLIRTLICGMIALPAAAQAEPKFDGEAVIGYGDVDGTGEAYGILSLTVSDEHKFESGNSMKWDLRGRARTDQSSVGHIDDSNIDGSVEFDLGSAGTLGFSTYNEIDQYPWADGELYNRRSVGVFPVIRKRYDSVADSQHNQAREKVDPDLLVTYSNKFGKVGLDVVANPLGRWDDFEKSDLRGSIPTLEGKLTLPTKNGIYSIAYNDLDDAELQVIYPMREIGLTLIGRYSIDEGDWGDSRTNLAVRYRAKDMGFFKGAMLAHAFDDSAERSMLNLGFGGEQWELKIAGDTDGDIALEGSYDIAENSTIKFGWDNGHGAMQGFDDAAFPAPVFAAARGDAFEIAFVQKF